LLQAAYGNYQIGAFENFHQLVEYTLIVLRPGPKVFFQYELRFVNRLKSQLLISHLFFSHQRNAVQPGKRSKKSSRLLGDIPAFFDYSINFYFNAGGLSPRIAALPGSTPLSEVPLASSNGRASEPAWGRLQQDRATLFRKIRLSFRR
jgi:hypothetical protein